MSSCQFFCFVLWDRINAQMSGKRHGYLKYSEYNLFVKKKVQMGMCDTLVFPNTKRIGQKKFLEQKYSWKFNKGLAAKDAQPARDWDELRIQDGG